MTAQTNQLIYKTSDSFQLRHLLILNSSFLPEPDLKMCRGIFAWCNHDFLSSTGLILYIVYRCWTGGETLLIRTMAHFARWVTSILSQPDKATCLQMKTFKGFFSQINTKDPTSSSACTTGSRAGQPSNWLTCSLTRFWFSRMCCTWSRCRSTCWLTLLQSDVLTTIFS